MSSRLYRALEQKEAGVKGSDRAARAKDVLDDIIVLLQKDLQSSERSMREKVNYTDPSWGYMQADYLGEQRTLQKVIDLLTVKQKRN